MQYIPIKTRTLKPPQDDLFSVLDEYLVELQEKDIVVISSKVVAISEGRCVPEAEFDKSAHITREADVIIPRKNWKTPLTIINNVMVSGAGVDRSNSDGFYTLLPANPFVSAKSIYQYLEAKFSLKEFGVIVSDSRSHPCRYGATGCAIGFWGICPLESHIGKKDLFGRVMKVERSNVVDGIVAGANLVMGEVAESTPVVIARNVPQVEFKTGDLKDELFCPVEEDIMSVLYEKF